MSALGQSLPIRSAPVPNNVRYASNSDRILRRSEMTLSANSGLMRCINYRSVVGAGKQRRRYGNFDVI